MPKNYRRRKLCQQFTLVWIVLLLFGCSKPELSQLPADATILAFGDSLTVGVGAEKSASYPVVLEHLSGRRVVNEGISGEVTAEGLERLPEVLVATDPELLILLEGGNDILRNTDYAEIKRNLGAMIEAARRLDIPVILIGVPERSLFAGTAPFYAELAEEHQLVFEADLIGKLLRRPGYKSDPIHLNKAGYQAMAKGIHEILVDNGAL